MPRIVTATPSTSIHVPVGSELMPPILNPITASNNVNSNSSYPVSQQVIDNSPNQMAPSTMDRSHQEAKETSGDHSSHTNQPKRPSIASYSYQSSQSSEQRRLPIREELLLQVRGLKNTLLYSDLTAELTKAQSNVMNYCCQLWMDLSRFVGLSHTNSSTQ